jgi:dihydropteroate synthase
MTDWSRDPVFGDFAARFAPRGLLPPDERVLPWASIAARWGQLSQPEWEELRSLAPDLVLPGAKTIVGRVSFKDRGVLERLAHERPYAAALLEADARTRTLPASPRIMGIVNVTSDSFSDGGAFLDPARAVEHGLGMVEQGAEVLDVGGESTRPGAVPVSEAEELERVLPVIQRLARESKVPISADTTKARVAEAALAAGATIVNDVSAGRFEPRILDVTARARAGFVVMHMLGTPREMQQDPRYDDVVTEVTEFLRARCRVALEAGIQRERLWVDPGIGFGKLLEHNLELLRHLNELRSLGLPIVLGVSRKSFIAAIEHEAGFERSAPDARLGGSLAALTIGVQNGAEILRVHDVRESRQAAFVARATARYVERKTSGT